MKPKIPKLMLFNYYLLVVFYFYLLCLNLTTFLMYRGYSEFHCFDIMCFVIFLALGVGLYKLWVMLKNSKKMQIFIAGMIITLFSLFFLYDMKDQILLSHCFLFAIFQYVGFSFMLYDAYMKNRVQYKINVVFLLAVLSFYGVFVQDIKTSVYNMQDKALNTIAMGLKSPSNEEYGYYRLTDNYLAEVGLFYKYNFHQICYISLICTILSFLLSFSLNKKYLYSMKHLLTFRQKANLVTVDKNTK